MKDIIKTDQAPAAIGPYSQAVKSGHLVFLSGQIPLDPMTMTLKSGFAEQARQVFNNIKAVVEAAGGEMKQIIKLTIYVTDLANLTTLNNVMSEYFEQPYPARTAIQVVALPKDAEIKIDGILILDLSV